MVCEHSVIPQHGGQTRRSEVNERKEKKRERERKEGKGTTVSLIKRAHLQLIEQKKRTPRSIFGSNDTALYTIYVKR